MIAEGDVPLVKSFGAEMEFGTNGKVSKPNSRMSTLLFWQGRGKGANGTQNGRNWIHPPDALVKGHVAYLVKFLGSTTVDMPKGIEVVQEAIKRLHFTQQLKKSETKEAGKCKKVEVTISIEGVAIQEPRSNTIMHQFPLQRISYCADDKGAKKYFSFIAKSDNGTEGRQSDDVTDVQSDKYECFVFISTKLASEITLTIGQAFELAYRRFMNDHTQYLELEKLTLLNKKMAYQMKTYKKRLQELSMITYKEDLSAYLARNALTDVTDVKVPEEIDQQLNALAELKTNLSGYKNHKDNLLKPSTEKKGPNNKIENNLLLSTPPLHHNGRINHNSYNSSDDIELLGDAPAKNPVVGTRLEGLLLNSDSDSDFDPRAFESDPPSAASPALPPALAGQATPPPPLLAPPPKAAKRHTPQGNSLASPAVNGSDIFGSSPFDITSDSISPPNVQTSPFAAQTTLKPNYDISGFNLETSVFNSSTSFTNGLSGYDPFDTQKTGNIFGNTYNGFGNLSDKQPVALNSSFNGFLDKTISEMKDDYVRGISFGNEDFSISNLDPLKNIEIKQN